MLLYNYEALIIPFNECFEGAAPTRCPTNIVYRIMCLARCTSLMETLNYLLFIRNYYLFIVLISISIFAEEEVLYGKVNNIAEVS